MIVNRHDVERLWDDEILPRLKKYTKYVLGPELNHGHYGVAYALQNDSNKVLKVTADRDEARTSSKLVGRTFKHVVQIYRVFEFKTLKGVYFLLEERLQPLNSEEAVVVKHMGLPSTDLIENLLHAVQKYGTLENLRTYASERLPADRLNFFTDKLLPIIQTLEPLTIAFAMHLLTWRTPQEFQEAFNLREGTFLIMQKALDGLKEMTKNDIEFSDTQSVNLMKDTRYL